VRVRRSKRSLAEILQERKNGGSLASIEGEAMIFTTLRMDADPTPMLLERQRDPPVRVS
jgi:hypothetical protein